MSRDKQLWKRMREKRKEEKRKAAQREEEERWRQEQEVASLRRQARAHESHLRHTEEARVKALMRGEAARSQSTAEQILKHGPKQAFFWRGSSNGMRTTRQASHLRVSSSFSSSDQGTILESTDSLGARWWWW